MDSGDVFKIPTSFLNQSVQKPCPRDSWSSAADLSARGFDSALSHFLCKWIALSCTDETEIPIDHWLILLLKPPPPSSKEKTFLCAKHWTGQHVLFIILWRFSPSFIVFFCLVLLIPLSNTHYWAIFILRLNSPVLTLKEQGTHLVFRTRTSGVQESAVSESRRCRRLQFGPSHNECPWRGSRRSFRIPGTARTGWAPEERTWQTEEAATSQSHGFVFLFDTTRKLTLLVCCSDLTVSCGLVPN